MNTPAHWLSVWTMVTCLTMGLLGPLGIGPRFMPPSWAALYAVVPGASVIYPGLFVITGVIAALGIRSAAALRLSCWMLAGLFLIWAVVGLILALLEQPGANLQGPVANFQIVGAHLALAYYVSVGVRGDQINRQVERLAEQVHNADEHGAAPTE